MPFPLPVRSLGPSRLLAADREYPGRRAGGGLPPHRITDIAAEAGIRGRGGAGFPLGVKLATVSGADDPVRYVVANAEEGEPASVKDRYLLRERPLLVLEGLGLAAHAVGARRAYLCTNDRAGADQVREALRSFRPDCPVEVVLTDPGYVAGEETALVQALGGDPALPTAKPHRPWQKGLHEHPTLICNAETLAQLALAVRLGPDGYRARGTDDSPGTFLVTLSGAGSRPALYETAYGTPLGEVAAAHRGTSADITGVLAGGLAGGLLPASALDLPLTHAAFSDVGSTLGCGAFVLLAGDCPVGVAADAAAFFDRHNAGQCGACVKGTAALATTLARLTGPQAHPQEVALMERRAVAMSGRGNCATPDAAAILIGSLLRHHRDLVTAHTESLCGRCAAARTAPVRAFEFRIPLED